jgi:hypothetical protein
MNRIITLKLSSLTFLLAFGLLPTALFSQIFYDGFESGAYMPTWSDGAGTYTRTVTTVAPAVGAYCFSLTGGANSHYDGIYGAIPTTQATDISWRVKGDGTAHGGYIVVGDANTNSNSGIAFVRITDIGTLRFYDGTTNFDYPIVAGTWYNVEMRDIDWTNKHFDIWIDGVLEVTDFAFRSTATTEISEVHFYNFHSTTTYLDEFIVNGAPPCTTPPTAVCQNIDIYLDAAGNASIAASDLDGGSIDNCGTAGLTFTASQTTFTCVDVTTAAPSDALVLTGVIDGPLSGGTPKAVELFVAADIADLSMYGLGSANNGGGTDGIEFTFPADAATAGQYIYVATDSVQFNSWFGFFPNYTNGNATNVNGDDAIELFYDSVVVDIFGDINVDGTGQPWEYLDGWAYRNSSTGPDGSTFVLGNWSYSGINVLDGETTNASAATPFPIASYVSGGAGTSVTLTVTDGNTLTDNCIATVTVLDTISPTASQLSPVLVECIGDVPVADPLVFTDEADNCSTPTVLFVGDVSNGLTCPETITRTYSITDASGNTTTFVQVITVNDVTNPTASAPVTINVECIGDVPVADILVVTDEADNCANATVAFVGDVSDGLTCPETITRTYSITDNCGNQITVDQSIVVDDITAPTLGASPADFNSSCDVTLAELGAATATDNCSGSVTGTPDVAFPITAAGTTTVTWTFTDACGNESMQTQDVIIAPHDVTTTLTDLTITANNTTTSYQWIDCATNNFIGGETGVSYTATANGSYAVIITANGCSDTSACTVIDNVGIDGLDFETLSLFPNPTSNGMFSINTEGAIKEIELIDMMGRIVQVEINVTDKTVDASKLEPGKYIVQIKSNEDRILKGTIVIQ